MAAKTTTNKGKATSSASNIYTLPLSCQICLGKVRQPVVCSNFHVFCSACMDTWRRKSNRCPSCRVLIDHSNPVQQIRGGLGQTDNDDLEKSTPELRKTRFDLLYKDYEDNLEQLEREVRRLRNENACLKTQLSSTQSSDSNKGYAAAGGGGGGGGGTREQQQLHLLTSKLQDAQKLYDQVKQDMAKLKKENFSLKDSNATLTLENTRLREEMSSRSPQKFGRLTVATLESQLEKQRKEVERLTRALERSDHYIESLQSPVHTSEPRDPDPRLHSDLRDLDSLRREVNGRVVNGSGSSKSLSSAGGVRSYSSSVPDSSSSSSAVKRQLFKDFGSEDSVGKPDSVGQSRSSLEGRFSERFSSGSMLPPSGGSEPEESVVGSIMRKSDHATSTIFTSTTSTLHDGARKRDRSPKRVHFNLSGDKEKKSNDSSSFNLEVPSPITASSSTLSPRGDYGLTSSKPPSGMDLGMSPRTRSQTQRSLNGWGGSSSSSSSFAPDWVDRIDDDGDCSSVGSPRRETNDLSSRRRPQQTYTLKEEAVSSLLSSQRQAQRGGGRKGGSRDHYLNASDNLSEPEFSTPRSLDDEPHSGDFNLLSGPPRRSDPSSSSSRSPLQLSGMGSRSSSLTDIRRSDFSHIPPSSSISSSSRPPLSGTYSTMTRSFSSEHLSSGAAKPHLSLGRFGDASRASSGFLTDRPRSVDPVTSSYPMNIPASTLLSQGGHGLGYGAGGGLSSMPERPHSVDLVSSSSAYSLNMATSSSSLSSSQAGGRGYTSGVSSLLMPERPRSVDTVVSSYMSSMAPTSMSQPALDSYSSRGHGEVGVRDRRTSAVNNYSYVSTASSQGDSHRDDSFLPDPRKRLFEEDSDLGTPSKATRVL